MRKIISTFFVINLFMSFSTNAYAGMINNFFGIPRIKPSITDGNIVAMSSDVFSYLQFFGFAVAIGMTIYAGMKYMMSAANDKAELKNSSLRLLGGALVVAGATGLFPIIWETFGRLSH